ncbi:hypothetical protein C370_01204 [Cryptococcus neoformans A1-35-8]|nr:hypothetical protein C370_01204 [Cryptococcus neoformans var. grubii A1-35-8]
MEWCSTQMIAKSLTFIVLPVLSAFSSICNHVDHIKHEDTSSQLLTCPNNKATSSSSSCSLDPTHLPHPISYYHNPSHPLPYYLSLAGHCIHEVFCKENHWNEC